MIILGILAVLIPVLIAISPWIYKKCKKWKQEKRSKEEEKKSKEKEEWERMWGNGPEWHRIDDINDI